MIEFYGSLAIEIVIMVISVCIANKLCDTCSFIADIFGYIFFITLFIFFGTIGSSFFNAWKVVDEPPLDGNSIIVDDVLLVTNRHCPIQKTTEYKFFNKPLVIIKTKQITGWGYELEPLYRIEIKK